ncbi:MAG: alpha/beta hydrolase [Pseudomonadota bacterium]
MPFVTVNDIRMHYVEAGSGEPLVVLHGLGSCAEDWEEQVARFDGSYRVIVPDLRGFGLTDKADGPYSVAGFAADVSGLLAQLGVERFNLLGFSMGGAVAFQLALNAPDAVQSLIIVNSLPSFELDSPKKRFMVASRMMMARLLGMERVVKILSARVLPEPHQREAREELIERHKTNSTACYLAAIRALAGWSIRPRLGELRMPVLVVASDQDYTDVAEKEATVAALPDARLAVIRDSRHVVYVDQPEAFTRAVLEFLASVSP